MIVISIMAAAAAAPWTAAPVVCNGAVVPNLNPATMVHVRVDDPNTKTPMGPSAGATLQSLESNPTFTEMGNGGAPYGYSRLTIRFTPCRDAYQRTLIPEQRNAIYRYFFGKQADKVLKLKVIVSPLGVSSSTTVSAIHRKSGKGGEEWTTEVENDGILLPYFRVDANTLVRLESDFESTREYNSSISADVLDIIKRASVLITPTAPLITAQNKDRFNDAANFVDNSINGLLKVSIKEKPMLEVSLDGLKARRPLAIVTLVIPRSNDAFPSPNWPMIVVGQWTISADALRPSMLARSDPNGAVIAGSYTASSVMNFSVSDKKTLKEALAGSSSVTAARDALVGASNSDAADPGRTFCQAVATEVDALGLTPVDGAIATWAALKDLALPRAKMENAVTGCSDVEHFQDIAAPASTRPVKTGK